MSPSPAEPEPAPDVLTAAPEAPVEGDAAAAGFPALRVRERLRVAFVGQRVYFESCALDRSTPELETTFIDFRAGADGPMLRASLDAWRPHVVVVFRPEIIPAGLFAGLAARTVGYLTEPIPRRPEGTHPDLTRRLADLRAVDAANFDRIVSFDPLIAERATAAGAPVWRSLPLPVADSLFSAGTPGPTDRGSVFIGRATDHRESYLIAAKHLYDTVHIAHGVWGERLVQLLADHDIGINLHNEAYPSFENRVPLMLAAGLLVVSEPLSPPHGLEPDLDFLQIDSPDALLAILYTACRHPDAYRAVRVRGRLEAERFRASRIYPRLLADVIDDVRIFGGRGG